MAFWGTVLLAVAATVSPESKLSGGMRQSFGTGWIAHVVSSLIEEEGRVQSSLHERRWITTGTSWGITSLAKFANSSFSNRVNSSLVTIRPSGLSNSSAHYLAVSNVEARVNSSLIGTTGTAEARVNSSLVGTTGSAEARVNSSLVGTTGSAEARVNSSLVGTTGIAEARVNSSLVGTTGTAEARVNRSRIGTTGTAKVSSKTDDTDIDEDSAWSVMMSSAKDVEDDVDTNKSSGVAPVVQFAWPSNFTSLVQLAKRAVRQAGSAMINRATTWHFWATKKPAGPFLEDSTASFLELRDDVTVAASHNTTSNSPDSMGRLLPHEEGETDAPRGFPAVPLDEPDTMESDWSNMMGGDESETPDEVFDDVGASPDAAQPIAQFAWPQNYASNLTSMVASAKNSFQSAGRVVTDAGTKLQQSNLSSLFHSAKSSIQQHATQFKNMLTPVTPAPVTFLEDRVDTQISGTAVPLPGPDRGDLLLKAPDPERQLEEEEKIAHMSSTDIDAVNEASDPAQASNSVHAKLENLMDRVDQWTDSMSKKNITSEVAGAVVGGAKQLASQALKSLGSSSDLMVTAESAWNDMMSSSEDERDDDDVPFELPPQKLKSDAPRQRAPPQSQG